MIKRRVSLCRLHAECIEEYRKLHDSIWPDLLRAYRSAGVKSISCFLHGTQLIVYVESDSSADTPDRRPADVELRWSALMEPMADKAFETLDFEEVFYMPPATAEHSFALESVR